MKALLFLFSFIFFVTKCQCETESYKQLVAKLDKLEALVVDGYELFHKKKLGENDIKVETNASANNNNNNQVSVLTSKIRNFLSKFLELQIPGHTDLLHLIRELAVEPNGIKYLVESYEEFNQLMHVINFHYDLLRAKLHDMCAHDYCKIPEHLKISDKELDMLKKVVLGYRKPLDNIKDDIGKLETFITKNKITIKNISDLIIAENKKRSGHPTTTTNGAGTQPANGSIAAASSETTQISGSSNSGSSSTGSSNSGSSSTGSSGTGSTGTGQSPPAAADASSTNANYEAKKIIYQAVYNTIFYTNQLQEAQKLIAVLEKRVKVLKEHKDIKVLLEQVAKEKEKLPSDYPNTTNLTNVHKEAESKIAELEKKIEAIAKTVNFDLDGLFTDAEELEYYLREKAKMAGTLIIPESTKSAGTPGKTVPTLKETYPHGISYALAENSIYELIEKIGSDETFGDLQNPDDGKQPKKGILINETKRKELLEKIMNKIKIEEDKLPNLKKEYEEKYKVYEAKVNEFKPAFNHFYEARLDNTLVENKFDDFKKKREAYMEEKKKLESCSYEQNSNLINKLKKQLTYLEDYVLRKDIADDEIKHFSFMEWKLKSEIYDLAQEIRKNENKLTIENKFDFSGVVELQVQKVLIIKKIEALKNVQNLLKNAKVKDDLYIPKVYKTSEKPEPYYLMVLKREIDKLKDFIPKIESMIATEKNKPTVAAADIVAKGQSLRGASETGTTGNTVNAQTAVVQPQHQVVNAVTVQPGTTGHQAQGGEAETQTNSVQAAQVQQTPAGAGGQVASTQTISQAPAPTQASPEPAPAAPPSTPAAAVAPAPTMSKLEYLEKLLDFLKSAYACHKHIFVTNSTMKKELLDQYKLNADEQNKINETKCDELDLLFNVQNNLPAMYSIYDSMSNELQNLYIELYQKEMVYNIYKNKDTDKKIKAFLETLKSKAAAPAQSAAKPSGQAGTTPVTTTAPVTTTTVTPSPQTSVVTSTPPTPQAEENRRVGGNSEEKPEADTAQVEKFYEKHLSQIDKYNDYFQKFLESQKDEITKMDETKWKALGAEIEELKKKLQVSLDHYGKYKLKLERLLKKKNKISNSKDQIKKLTSLKNKLERRQNLLNNPTSVLKNYTAFFNKKRETEKKEVENTLKNTEILLKYYKARAKYYIGEPFPLKTLSEESMQKEDNYLNLEKFRVLSRLEGRLGKNIELEKENISYLSSGLHHVLTELKEIIKNKKYSGNDHTKNIAAVKEALQAYQELIPKVTTQEGASTTAATLPVTVPSAVPGGLPGAGVPGAAAGLTPPPPAGSVPATGPGAAAGSTEENVAAKAQDYAEDYDKVIALPLFGNNDDDGEEDQVTTGEAESEAPEILVPAGISDYDVVYLKPLAGMYKTIKKQLENHVNAFNTNITDMLDSRLKKRNYFLEVLNSDLNPFKYSSSGEYIIKDPYKLLDLEKKKKLIGSYKYIGASIDMDLATANDGVTYYNKMGELYKTHLDGVKTEIKKVEDDIKKQDEELKKLGNVNSQDSKKNEFIAKKAELEKYLPFLNSLQKEYESLVSKVNTYTDNLKKVINNCQLEKKEAEITVKKLQDYNKMDEKLEEYKKSEKKNEVKSSGLLEKLMKSKLIKENESKEILSQLLNVQTQLLTMSSEHTCIDTNVPDNAACYRYLDGTEEWRCLLTFKEEGGKCVPASNVTCKDNNGGCAPEAECKMTDSNKIVCKCTKEGSEPLFEGVFCSSSSFLSLSFLLLMLLFLLCMEL
ncbi:major blood-stage surface antigen Pv200 [Plasmodium vivax]|uniref:Merozoite surface protein 1 n=5 Tax=Plasmodium vivax TaxID=5855 RepID=A5K724_PLAVS|nr:major blood-stage surface antigen Pv200 [Plasmodium vivax]AAA29735.1 Pv200 [Plasmodium vivax]AAN86207.1 merozoite surface protein 1 [Plasmodium vivax]EDL45115.1 major blood-stage surface antigen Pv200 [Plasmodium vivax]|eukprot:XP_001614842.1 major blood-stage surface antigen Pv200 [Plasmodium vivax Sal-1]